MNIPQSISAVIVEDNVESEKNLDRKISKYTPEIQIIGTARSVEEAYDLLQKTQPDLVFLDVELGDSSAFDLLAKLEAWSFQIIFVTGFVAYGAEAIRANINPVDYLSKPVDPRCLKEAVSRIKKKPAGVDMLRGFEFAQSFHEEHPLAIKSAGITHYIPIADILYCKADRAYAKIACRNSVKELFEASKPLKHFQERLRSTGVRKVDKSTMINIKEVYEINSHKCIVCFWNSDIEVKLTKAGISRLKGMLG